MFDKHLAVGEAYQTNAPRPWNQPLPKRVCAWRLILNEAAKSAN